MAKGLTAQAAVEKWSKNAGQAASDYVAGVNAMTVNPMEKAAASQDKYAAGVARAVAENRFADGCRSVSLSTLKQIATQKGGTNFASGVRAMRPEKKAQMIDAIQTSQAVASQVEGMPTMTLEDRIAKSAEYQRQRAAARSSRR